MGLHAESREPLGEREPEALNKGRVGRAGSRASSELGERGREPHRPETYNLMTCRDRSQWKWAVHKGAKTSGKTPRRGWAVAGGAGGGCRDRGPRGQLPSGTLPAAQLPSTSLAGGCHEDGQVDSQNRWGWPGTPRWFSAQGEPKSHLGGFLKTPVSRLC